MMYCSFLLASLIVMVQAQAPNGSCCVASYGSTSGKTCDHCAALQHFECRPSHQQWGVSNTSKDCVSFVYADEASCIAAGYPRTSSKTKWKSPSSKDGFFCPRTTVSFPSPPPPPPPPPPGQIIDNAPEGECCLVFYGVSKEENPNACDEECYSNGNGFTCRDSYQRETDVMTLKQTPFIDTNSKDCISFEYATEADCNSDGKRWKRHEWDCSRNDTQLLAAAAKSSALSLSLELSLITVALLCLL